MDDPDDDTLDDTVDNDAHESVRSAESAAPHSRLPWVVTAAAALLAVGALVFAVLQQQDRADLQSDVDARSEASDVAARFAERLLTYEFDLLDEQADGIESLSTVEFADEFRDAISGGLGASIEQLEASSTATVQDVLSSEVRRGRARVIVIVDSEITSDAGTRANIDTYLDVTLLRLEGAWLVDDVQTVSSQSDAPELDGGSPDSSPGAAADSTPTSEAPEDG